MNYKVTYINKVGKMSHTYIGGFDSISAIMNFRRVNRQPIVGLEEQEGYESGDCQECGTPLNNADGLYCPECLVNRSNI